MGGGPTTTPQGTGTTPEAGRDTGGWTASTVQQSLYTAVLQGMAGLGAVVLFAIALTPATAEHRWWLLPLHAVLVIGCLGASQRRSSLAVTVVAIATGVIVLVDTALSADAVNPVTMATIWLLHLSQVLPSVLLRGRVAIALSAALSIGVPLAVYPLRPDWVELIVMPWVVTSVLIALAGFRMFPRLTTFAREIDRDLAAMAEAQRAAVAASAARDDAAEQARVLHDTVINTLAAVASGGRAVEHVDLVRDRCRRDLEVLDGLLAGRDVPIDRLAFADLGREAGVVVRRRGLDDRALESVTAGLPTAVVRALDGGVREAVRNAAKHAGVSIVDLAIERSAGSLTCTVRDAGCGFSGEYSSGRGVAESIVNRGREAGVAARVYSEPGIGTTVELRYSLQEPPPPSPPVVAVETDHVVVEQVGRRACWLWCAGLVIIGIGIELFGRPGRPSVVYAMLAVIAAVSLGARRVVMSKGHLSAPATVFVVASVPVTFTLAMWSIEFGRRNPTSVQAIALTAGLVITLTFGRTRAPFVAAMVALVLTAAATAGMVARSDTTAATFILVATAPAVFVGLGWSRFHQLLDRVGRRSAEAFRRAESSRLDQARQVAAMAARERWRVAGMASCAALLQRLASGDVYPLKPGVRSECATEEAYLRQVCLLDARLVRMGGPLARSLAAARSGQVDLVVRTGRWDVETDTVADAFGDLLEALVRHSSPGEQLTASLFATGGELSFRVVCPTRTLLRGSATWTMPEGWECRRDTFGDQGLLDVFRAFDDGWRATAI